uniref:receptor protein-tyrosine kinase n=1 Tax=Electrophorus electricus TaxID=8005 RepID=A0A4W4FPD3_ELEEL
MSEACPVGTYKASAGSAPCIRCPANSRTGLEASEECECRSGFYRAPGDASTTACTGPPSAPVSLSWEYESSKGGVALYWKPPQDMGGRSEVWYGVVCRICPAAKNSPSSVCSWCGETVTYGPSQTGLRQTKVTLGNLLTRVTYIQAMNDVSALSPFPPQSATINFTTSQSVPSEVPVLHQLSSSSDSITLSWPQPNRPNGDILEYQLRYYDKTSVVSVFSETNTMTVTSLIPGSIYAFQIRARNERGFGPYSHTIYFSTMARGMENSRQIQNRLPLMVGSVMGGAAFLLVVAAVVVVFYYVDPSMYEDPSEAVKEFAREIEPTQLKIEEVIRAAQFGEVSRGRYRPLGRREMLVAVKTLRWGVTDHERGVFLREAGVLGQFDHPNVLKLEGVIIHTPPERIITELMENGPLDAFLRENEDQFSVLQLVGMLRGVGAGMRYLSERNFVHRDLAARNVLVNSNLVCKVSDFGLSSKIPVRWTAPEAFQHRKFSSASDVWSFGILMWEVMSYGDRPYWDMSNQEVRLEQYRLPAPSGCPSALHALMLQCWQGDRQDRPGFDSLLSSLDRLIRHPASLKAELARPTQPLLSPTHTDLSSVTTVHEWLIALRMDRYRDEFDRAQLHSLERVIIHIYTHLHTCAVYTHGH